MSELIPNVLVLDKGLDLQSAKIIAPPGTLLDSLNYEQVDFQGQKRIDGYTRYDGSPLSAIDDFYVSTDVDITTETHDPYVIAFYGGKPFGIQVATDRYAIIDFTALPEGQWGKDAVASPEQHYEDLLTYNDYLRERVESLPGAVIGLHWFKDRLYAVADLQSFEYVDLNLPQLTGVLPQWYVNSNYEGRLLMSNMAGTPEIIAVEGPDLPDTVTSYIEGDQVVIKWPIDVSFSLGSLEFSRVEVKDGIGRTAVWSGTIPVRILSDLLYARLIDPSGGLGAANGGIVAVNPNTGTTLVSRGGSNTTGWRAFTRAGGFATFTIPSSSGVGFFWSPSYNKFIAVESSVVSPRIWTFTDALNDFTLVATLPAASGTGSNGAHTHFADDGQGNMRLSFRESMYAKSATGAWTLLRNPSAQTAYGNSVTYGEGWWYYGTARSGSGNSRVYRSNVVDQLGDFESIGTATDWRGQVEFHPRLKKFIIPTTSLGILAADPGGLFTPYSANGFQPAGEGPGFAYSPYTLTMVATKYGSNGAAMWSIDEGLTWNTVGKVTGSPTWNAYAQTSIVWNPVWGTYVATGGDGTAGIGVIEPVII